MKMFNALLLLMLLGACNVMEIGQIKINSVKTPNPNQNLIRSLNSVQLINNQFVLTGANLSSVTSIIIKEGSSETVLGIESVTANKIVANTLSHVTFAAGKVFSFILSDVHAASSFTVDFSL